MEAVVALNSIAQHLGHLCALEDVEGIESVAALEAAWLTKGSAANEAYANAGRPEFMGIAGWKYGQVAGEDMWFDVDSPENRPGIGVAHCSGTGRIRVHAIDRWESVGARWVSLPRIAIEVWAGPAGADGPRLVAAIVAQEDSHGLRWEAAYDGLTQDDLGPRADRLEFLVWAIDHLIGGARMDDWADLVPRIRAAWERLIAEHAEAVSE